jgi:hypothetical protein
MRLTFTAALLFCAALLTGCAGSKLNIGYDFNAKRLFAEIEQPLSGYKK